MSKQTRIAAAVVPLVAVVLAVAAWQFKWVGRYAIPVPPNVAALASQGDTEAGLHVEITTWPHGDVVEMLHVGPYDREEPTIAELTQFIQDCHYEIVGKHEEEYLKDPGQFSKGNPEKYLTIIRDRVKKVA